MNVETFSIADVLRSVPSLRQQAMVTIAETLINRDPERFISLASNSVPRNGDWDSQWNRFKQRLSRDIASLPLVENLKGDVSDVFMNLFLNAREYTIFCKVKKNMRFLFTPWCDVDLDRMMKDYVERMVPHQSDPERLDFLLEACSLCHADSIRHVLCIFLEKIQPEWYPLLEPVLRNAECRVNMEPTEFFHCNVTISFLLGDIKPSVWNVALNMFNILCMNCIPFSLEANALTISFTKHYCFIEIKSLWFKMTAGQKRELAETFSKIALNSTDIRFLSNTIPYMDSAKVMELIRATACSFILCFLKRPFSQYFIPALQLVQENLKSNVYDCIVFKLLLQIAYMGGHCSDSRNLFHRFWRHISSQDDEILANKVFCSIEMSSCCIQDFLDIDDASCFYVRDTISKLYL